MVRKLMFRLLPVQILLAAAGTINMIVSSYFASNYVGTEAMSAVGLYGPLNMFFGAFALMLVGGSSILCGEYLGKNNQVKLQEIYSLDLIISVLAGLFFTVTVILLALFDLTGFLTHDATVRPLLNRYLIGQAVGIIPFILSSQFPDSFYGQGVLRDFQDVSLVADGFLHVVVADSTSDDTHFPAFVSMF